MGWENLVELKNKHEEHEGKSKISQCKPAILWGSNGQKAEIIFKKVSIEKK